MYASIEQINCPIIGLAIWFANLYHAMRCLTWKSFLVFSKVLASIH